MFCRLLLPPCFHQLRAFFPLLGCCCCIKKSNFFRRGYIDLRMHEEDTRVD
jgi:hypothetical protein